MEDETEWDRKVRESAVQAVKSLIEAIRHEQTSIFNWLFAANTGGMGGLLAYIATKGTQTVLIHGLFAFFLGLVLVIVSRVIMFYWLYKHIRELTEDIDKLDAKTIKPFELATSLRGRANYNKTVEVLTWVSGGCFMLGAVFVAIGICTH